MHVLVADHATVVALRDLLPLLNGRLAERLQ